MELAMELATELAPELAPERGFFLGSCGRFFTPCALFLEPAPPPMPPFPIPPIPIVLWG